MPGVAVSEFEFVRDRGDAGLDARIVSLAAGRAGNTDRADDRAGRFDHAAAADRDDPAVMTMERRNPDVVCMFMPAPAGSRRWGPRR